MGKQQLIVTPNDQFRSGRVTRRATRPADTFHVGNPYETAFDRRR
jgi:hypothetical protein